MAPSSAAGSDSATPPSEGISGGQVWDRLPACPCARTQLGSLSHIASQGGVAARASPCHRTPRSRPHHCGEHARSSRTFHKSLLSPETTSTLKSRGWVRLLIAFVVAFDVAAFFQWADGAFQSEFGGHPDEATHYLTGLRARDAALHTWDRTHPGEVRHPVAALRRTPAFDVAQGAWMLIFGTSRIAALLFMAALAAATATLMFGIVRREFGDWAAFAHRCCGSARPPCANPTRRFCPSSSAHFYSQEPRCSGHG